MKPITIDCGRPISVGFTSYQPVPGADNYNYVRMDRYHNYFFTKDNWHWPEVSLLGDKYVIDGFSPNLNKDLHVGHMRQLALSCSLQRLLPRSVFVAFLGASLGIKEGSRGNLQEWFDFTGYHADVYHDTGHFGIPDRLDVQDGQGDYEGCQVYTGPLGPVVMVRSDGRPTYAYHDLGFAQKVSPTHYITGAEQKEHFASIGLADKHLPMGLVLGTDGKKLKSRDGEALLATEAIQMTLDRLEPTPEPRKVAWNVLAWNFLSVNRDKNVKFEVDRWTRADAAGMYISYTYARLRSILKQIGNSPPKPVDLLPSDVRLLGWAQYRYYWRQKAVTQFDPAPYANYLHDFARVIGQAYHGEKVVDGRPALQFAIAHAAEQFGDAMRELGMFTLEEV